MRHLFKLFGQITVWTVIFSTVLWSSGVPSLTMLPAFAVGPTVLKVEKINPSAVNVIFSMPVATSTATSTANYAFSDGLSVIDVIQQNQNIYRVIANGNLTASTTITVSANVQNLIGEANTDTGPKEISESNKIKIAQVMPGQTSTPKKEYIVLHNAGPGATDLSTYKLHIRTQDGTDTNMPLTFGTSTIPAYGFLMIASTQYTEMSGYADATFDASSTEMLDNGSVYISGSAVADTAVFDKVGWGTQVAGGYEGTVATAVTTNQALERKAFGDSNASMLASGGPHAAKGNGWDSDNNSFDFVLQTSPMPQNSGSPTEQPNQGGPGATSGGPMINHMPINAAPSSAALDVIAQMGDPSTPINSVIAELHYMIGDGTPTNNTASQYATMIGTHQSNGYFKFTIPAPTIGSSTTNGLYYYLKLVTNGGTRYMSANPAADAGGTEATVAQNPFITNVQNSAGWIKHNLIGTTTDSVPAAISGALVFLDGTGYSTTTAEDGSFTLANVKDGIYNLSIIKDGYYEEHQMNIFLNGANFNVGTKVMSSGQSGGMSGNSSKPRVNWTGPNDGMMGVMPGDSDFKIFIGFSKDLNSTTFTNSNIYLSVDGTTATSSVVTYDNNPDNNPANYPRDPYLGIVSVPAGGLLPNTTYYLIMTGNIRDTAGNALEGNRPQGGHVIQLTTGGNFMGGGFDPGAAGAWTDFGKGSMMPPFVMGTNPSMGSMNNPQNTKIYVNFSDPMSASSVSTAGNLKLEKVTISGTSESKTTVSAAIALDTSQKIAVITPSTNLTAGKYRLTITGALQSATGIYMGNPAATPAQNVSSYEKFRSDFEVGSVIDGISPMVKESWPINSGNSTNISTTPGMITFQFSENMDPSSINANTITLKRGSSPVTGNVNYDAPSRAAFFVPTVVLATDANYTLTVAGSASATSSSVTDTSGNPMTSDYAVNFTTAATGDSQNPKIMFAKGDDFALAITFSESMNSANITDSTNWPKSVLNKNNYIIKQGDYNAVFATGFGTATSVSLANAQFSYDGMTNTVKIENLVGTMNKNYYIEMASSTVSGQGGSGVVDITGNSLETVTNFQTPITDSSATKGMLGPSTGGTGGMMGPDLAQMGMMKAGAFPMNAMAGKTTVYFIDLPTTKAIVNNSTIVLTFPAGFDVSGAKKDSFSPVNKDINQGNAGTVTFGTAVETSGGANNDGVTVDAAARTVTITLAVSGGTPPNNDFLHLDLAGIVNSAIARGFDTSGYTVDMKIMKADGSLSETVSGMPFFINEAGNLDLGGSITLAGANGATDGTIKLFMGSPMTGPMEQIVTITDGSGSYSFTGLQAGSFHLFSEPTISIAGTNWSGLSMPEPIFATSSVVKNLTFAKEDAGSVTDLTVNLSGDFGNNDIDIFAGSPKGFKVKTIASAGNNPSAVHLFLPAGDWMVGVGPAMPKGVMSGPPVMPDWMPPMPQRIISSGTGTSSITISISAANMQIIGYVKDNSNIAISDAEVFAYQPNNPNGMGARAKTDTDGKFTLKIAQAGNYTIGSFKPGLPPAPEKSVNISANTGAVDGNSTADVSVDGRLITAASPFVYKINKPSRIISGKVSDGTNPVSYAPVWADKVSGFGHADTMTDASGNYILYVDEGAWSVKSNIPGFGNAGTQTVIVGSSDMTQNLAPESGVTYYTISGTITIGGAAQGNRPLRAVQYNDSGVYSGKEYYGQTSSNGSYSISVPGNNKYKIDIWTPDYGEVGLDTDEVANNPANVIVATSNITGKNITISSENLIDVTVSLANKSGYSGKEGFINIEGLDNSGKPNGNRKALRISDVNGADQTVRLKASTKYFFFLDVPGLGNYLPDVDSDTGRDPATDVVIATTTNRSVAFTLPNASAATAVISGTVLEGVASSSNAWVWVGKPTTGYRNGTKTNADGTYTLTVPLGSSYKMGVDKPGFMSSDPIDLNVTATDAQTKNFTLAAKATTISGYIYKDANSNNSFDAGEGVSNGWLRAESTNGKKTNAPVDGSGYFELGVVDGTWTIYAMADGYNETQHGSTVSVLGANVSNTNIKLSVNSSWTNKSKKSSITPASGGIIDDTSPAGTGIKLVVPPNALGNSSSAGNLSAAVTTAITKTNSTEPFGTKGTNIVATDNSGQNINTLNDYVDIEMVVYKAQVAEQITASDAATIYGKLKTTKNGYWDSTVNDWVNLASSRAAYYKSTSDDTDWTLYNAGTTDDFSAFIDTLIAGTSYYDYKLVLTSKTNHFTTFAVITPFVAAVAATPSPTPAPSSLGGGSAAVLTATSTACTDITYDDWQTCLNGSQKRNIKSQTPNNCLLTTDQISNQTRACTAVTETKPETKPTTTEIIKKPVQVIKVANNVVAKYTVEAARLLKDKITAYVASLKVKTDAAKVKLYTARHLNKLLKDKKVAEKEKTAMIRYITYGTESTKNLSADQRAKALETYKKNNKGQLPMTEKEWSNVIAATVQTNPIKVLSAKEQRFIKDQAEAKDLTKDSVNVYLAKIKAKKDAAKVKLYTKKHLDGLVKNVAVSQNQKTTLIRFITYGTESTKQLSAEKRAKMLEAYKTKNKGKLPKTEADWTNLLQNK